MSSINPCVGSHIPFYESITIECNHSIIEGRNIIDNYCYECIRKILKLYFRRFDQTHGSTKRLGSMISVFDFICVNRNALYIDNGKLIPTIKDKLLELSSNYPESSPIMVWYYRQLFPYEKYPYDEISDTIEDIKLIL